SPLRIRLAKAERMSYREKQQKNRSDSIKHRWFHACLQRSPQRAPPSCRVGSNCTTGAFGDAILKSHSCLMRLGVSFVVSLFVAGIRRLTRIDTRSIEQVVSLDGTDDIYNWPVIYGAEVGHWNLGDAEAKQLREYLLRGGFFMVDDFHGTDAYRGVREWETF